MVGVSTLLESIKRGVDTEQVTFTTTTLSGGQTHDFSLTEDADSQPEIDSISFRPSDATPPSEGQLLLIRPVVDSGTTDAELSIYESSNRTKINEVLRLQNLSVNDGAQTFQPGSANGVQFDNQDGDEEWFISITENNGTDSQFTVRLRWFDVK